MTDEEFEAVKAHCINPVDSRETGMDKPETLVTQFDEPKDVRIFDGFQYMEEGRLKELYNSLGLAMTFKDFLHIQKYFQGEEKRDPSMTEIRVLQILTGLTTAVIRHFSPSLRRLRLARVCTENLSKRRTGNIYRHTARFSKGVRKACLPDGSGADGDAETEKGRKACGSGRV